MSSSSKKKWSDRANAVLPAGGFGNFDSSVIIERGEGARVWDVDGNEYVDFLIGSGPMLLGHGHPEVVEAVEKQLKDGFTFFATSTPGIELAEMICGAMACADQLRFVSTGGEADMFAMRLARAFTGRDLIVKFEGAYHGMSDEGQMSLKPGRLLNFPNAEPDSAGILEGVRDSVLVAPWNDKEYMSQLFAEHGDRIAGLIAEPLQRIIPPQDGFLQHVRDLCTANDSILIFDEVVTGFRFAWGGGQEKYGVTPDICTLGKTIGGGMPLAAIAGRQDIMDLFDKSVAGKKWLMQVGTLSGNPVASVAGLKTLEILSRPGQYEKLRGIGQSIKTMLSDALSKTGKPFQIVGDDTLFDVIFTAKEVRDYRDTYHADKETQAIYNKVMREHGILKPGAKIYPCLAITEEDLEFTQKTIKAASEAIAQRREL